MAGRPTSSPGLASPSVNRGLTTAAYLALLLFGAAQGLVGAFFYNTGPPPLASLGFDAAILGTCLFGAWAMRSGTGGFVPAAGWFLVAFIMASGTHAGSVIITATGGGEWFLFGGAACALIGALAGLTLWSRPRAAGPPPGGR
jgi:Family of unknown function (DUF6113)